MDCLEMVRDFRGMSDEDFMADSHVSTIVNTNSPRQIDIPMAFAWCEEEVYKSML